MSRPIIREHNIEINEIIDREMNDAEFAIYQIEQETATQAQSEAQAKAAAKAALLERLGITEEEAKLLLG